MNYFVYRVATGDIVAIGKVSASDPVPDPGDSALAVAFGVCNPLTQRFDVAQRKIVAKEQVSASIQTLSAVSPSTVAFTLGEDCTMKVRTGAALIFRGLVVAGDHEFDVRDPGTYEITVSAAGKLSRSVTLVAT